MESACIFPSFYSASSPEKRALSRSLFFCVMRLRRGRSRSSSAALLALGGRRLLLGCAPRGRGRGLRSAPLPLCAAFPAVVAFVVACAVSPSSRSFGFLVSSLLLPLAFPPASVGARLAAYPLAQESAHVSKWAPPIPKKKPPSGRRLML